MSDIEAPYNNRQIERMLDTQSQDLKDHFDKVINPLTERVGLTNGRVKEIELKNASQAGFNKAMVWVAMACLTSFIGLFGWVLYQEANIDQRIQQDVAPIIQQALAEHAKQ